MRSFHQLHRLARVTGMLALISILSACAAAKNLDTTPFQDYQQAISTLKDQSDQALQTVYQQELDQFKAQVASGDHSKVAQLLLQFPPESDFVWTYAQASDNSGQSAKPAFASVADMQQTLAAMNTQLLSYSSLLVALAGSDDTTQFDPEAEAQKFDGEATSLLTQLKNMGVDTGNSTSKDLALFSTIASNLTKAYLEEKRIDLLTQILTAGLKPLENFVEQAQQAMAITAANSKDRYQDLSLTLVGSVIQNTDSNDLDKLLTLNDQLTQQLNLYQSIYNGYGALPSSQRQLITALKEGNSANLAELLSYASNIKKQYQALQQDNPNP